MPTSTAIRLAEIENDGYTIIENVMSKSLMTQIRTELAPYCQGKYPGRNNFEGTQTERVYALLAKAPAIAQIIEHPTTLELIDQLLPKTFFYFQQRSRYWCIRAKPRSPFTTTTALLACPSSNRGRASVSALSGPLMTLPSAMGLPRSFPAAIDGQKTANPAPKRPSKC